MEERLLKLTAQLGFVAVVIWVLAAAMGKRDDMKCKSNHKRTRRWQMANSNVNYSQPVTTSPRAEGANFFSTAAIAPLTRY